MIAAVEIVHGVNGDHDQRVLLQLPVSVPHPQVQPSASVNHLAQHLIDVVTVFAGPIGYRVANFIAMLTQVRRRSARGARISR